MKIMAKFAAVAAILATTGCQTRIVAVKHPEVVTPIERVVEIDGTNRVITADVIISSGGWEASARSPLWATEALSGLSLGVATNGTVYLKLDQYNRDLSTNAVLVVQSLSELAADVAGKVTAAICAYYGGGAVSATSKLGELTIKDITGKVQAKLAKKGITDANCKDCDPAAIASEVVQECAGGACETK